jgi:hypothetical protein
VSDPHLPGTEHDRLVLELDRALARAIVAPVVPPDLRARVSAALVRDSEVDRERKRQELVAAHCAAIAGLDARYRRRTRDALLAIAPVIFTAGLATRPLSEWLSPLSGSVSAPILAGGVALVLGLWLGAVVFQDMFEWRLSARRVDGIETDSAQVRRGF